MDKVMLVEGMSCERCASRISNALGMTGASNVRVDLSNKTVSMHLSKNIEDSKLRRAVENVGYRVISIN